MSIESVITGFQICFLFGVVVKVLNIKAMVRGANPDLHEKYNSEEQCTVQ
jgi:hypothetical protein